MKHNKFLLAAFILLAISAAMAMAVNYTVAKYTARANSNEISVQIARWDVGWLPPDTTLQFDTTSAPSPKLLFSSLTNGEKYITTVQLVNNSEVTMRYVFAESFDTFTAPKPIIEYFFHDEHGPVDTNGQPTHANCTKPVPPTGIVLDYVKGSTESVLVDIHVYAGVFTGLEIKAVAEQVN